MKLKIFAFLLFSLLINESLAQDNLIRQTNNGLVRGRISNDVIVWLGIPFAEPPINELRFKRPIPKNNWTGILNTTTTPPMCVQRNQNNSKEDCLYLNVLAPRNVTNSSSLAVMVYIHGGGLRAGSASSTGNRLIAVTNNIITVSIQYRLFVYGFLSLDIEEAPGNQGLLDQSMALKWVYDNIKYFGGDNQRITIGGGSAGSQSVGSHLLSKMSSNYFRNAFMLSGSPNALPVFTDQADSVRRNTALLKFLNCTGTLKELIECAKQIEPQTLIDGVYTFMSKNVANSRYFIGPIHFMAPSVDGYFMTDYPFNLLKKGEFKKCPVITGSVSHEGNSHINAYPANVNSLNDTLDYQDFRSLIKTYFYYYPMYPNVAKDAVLNKIVDVYSNSNQSLIVQRIGESVGDFSYLCPSKELSDYYSFYQQNVFTYYFNTFNLPAEWYGCGHGCEGKFIFGSLNSTDENAKTLSKIMMTYWGNFIKNNDPNIDENNNNLTWSTYKPFDKAYMNFDKTELKVKYDLKSEDCLFWEKLYLE